MRTNLLDDLPDPPILSKVMIPQNESFVMLKMESVNDMETTESFKQLPAKGQSPEWVTEQLNETKRDDYSWREGTLPLYVYWRNEAAYTASRDAYMAFFTENGMGKKAFPSVQRLESEVIHMTLSILNGPPNAGGSFTTGGTESIFQAVKSARNRARAEGRVGSEARLNIVVPESAHPAFNKAAKYLDLDEIRVPIGEDYRVDVTALEAAITESTVLIAGSAPGFPHGVFDNIEAIGRIAEKFGVWLHVDSCVGGMLAPFMRRNGESIPPFDFEVAGVTSMSVDLHKYGYAAKGASLVLVRDESLKKYHRFDFDAWPRGSYSTETFLGTRPAGPVASAWAVMNVLGEEGYLEGARIIAETKRGLMAGIDNIDGLEVVRPTELSFLLYRSTDPGVDINAVGDQMAQRGWFVGRSVNPPAIHLMLNPIHAPIVDRYVGDLAEATDIVRKGGLKGVMDTDTY